MDRSLKTRLRNLEKRCQPPTPSAVAIRYMDEPKEEALRRFRVETGRDPLMFITYYRPKPPNESP